MLTLVFANEPGGATLELWYSVSQKFDRNLSKDAKCFESKCFF